MIKPFCDLCGVEIIDDEYTSFNNLHSALDAAGIEAPPSTSTRFLKHYINFGVKEGFLGNGYVTVKLDSQSKDTLDVCIFCGIKVLDSLKEHLLKITKVSI